MDANINRIQPGSPLQQGAVKRIDPREKREGKDAQEFAQELAKQEGKKDRSGTTEQETESSKETSPVHDGVIGTHLDVTG